MTHFYTTVVFLLLLFASKAQINESFTDGEYLTNPSWISGTISDFSVSAGQLKSTNTTTNTSFYISTTNTLTSNCTWEFWINLQFATSGANYVDAYLISDNSNLLASNINGYFVRIGNTSDDICLYKTTNGTPAILIDGVNSSITSATNNIIKIKVTRTSANSFTLERDITGTGLNYISEGTITDASFTTSTTFGFLVKQSTASFFGKHLFDDINVANIILDVTPPSIISNTVISSTQVDVLFSEAIEITSAETLNNYFVNNGIGNPNNATRDASNFALVHLSFTTAFTNTVVNTLTVNGVQDNSLNTLAAGTTNFTYRSGTVLGGFGGYKGSQGVNGQDGGNGYAVIFLTVPGVFVHNDSGGWIATKEIYVKLNDEWQLVNAIWIKRNGDWIEASGDNTTNFLPMEGFFGVVARPAPASPVPQPSPGYDGGGGGGGWEGPTAPSDGSFNDSYSSQAAGENGTGFA